ncbi:sensor histidine kinase [Alkalimarinus coralli]|uniref:sensor histidine kinase n=1 Tax=Alkalimarinus coralli TaxID=2935863 RepID=UPI00202AC8BB|nr:ATP-binding protein [Alkalimarinus coralli]
MTLINSFKPSTQRGWLIGFFALLLLMVIWQTRQWATEVAYDDLSQDNMNELFRFSSSLSAVLQKYEPVPHHLSINPELSHFLGDISNPEKTDTINRYLATINQINRSSDIYILDSLGNTVASSNWDTSTSFIGKNFSFRPYFSQAMLGQNARYYALGTTSNERGYYFSSPISDDDDILGVVVLKISLADIEDRWASPWENSDIELIVTDPDGVIFISTRAEWRLKSLFNIPPSQMAPLKASKRYGVHIPVALNTQKIGKAPSVKGNKATLLTINSDADNAGNDEGSTTRFLSQHIDMPVAGWRVHALSKTDSIKKRVRSALLVVISTYLVLVLMILFVVERIRNERKLQQAKDMLEIRVKERTADLEQSNFRLRDEIDERHKTEDALKQAQEELIQAAKMAVLGQISAGINHELNQPLTAIRSYTQNAQQFLQRGNIETASSNLDEIIQLTDHMASIIGQLKVFSRKRGDTHTPIDALASLNAAIKIMAPQIKQQHVAVSTQSAEPHYLVLGDLIRLEQVFINLISNAIQAMAHSDPKQITIAFTKTGDSVVITIEDSGPGIDEETVNHIFEPFFTTKDISQGLGLGLSISHRIIEAMHGTISVTNSRSGGALFSITLPAHAGQSDGELEADNQAQVDSQASTDKQHHSIKTQEHPIG